jgi:predicted 3-demethylubiquinone-9 3-methyltransferase (glyoxalase superfamily)
VRCNRTKSGQGNLLDEKSQEWPKDKIRHRNLRTPSERTSNGQEQAKRAFDAMMGMKKIDVAAIKAARRG